ncbi:MAG: aminotransferase class I/II-fold pyridoxal phosphate-dependent enzyme [Methylococcaceae bacterium]
MSITYVSKSTSLKSAELAAFKPFAEIVAEHAKCNPHKIAYTLLHSNSEESISYAELVDRAGNLAAHLANQGLYQERVILLVSSGIEVATAFLACLMAGAIAVPTSIPKPTRTTGSFKNIVSNARPAAIITVSGKLAKLSKLQSIFSSHGLNAEAYQWIALDDHFPEEPAPSPLIYPDTIAFLQYTSGSTSEPRGVMVTHANLVANSEMLASGMHHNESSVIVSWLPLFHDMGLIGMLLNIIYVGMKGVLLTPRAFLQQPAIWLQAISKYRGTTCGGPNFGYDLCVKKISDADLVGVDLSSWKVAINGSEPVKYQSIKAFCERFLAYGFNEAAIFPSYGMAECTLMCSGTSLQGASFFPVDADRLAQGIAVRPDSTTALRQILVGCGGTRHLDQIVKIVSTADFSELAPYKIGEIWVKGSHVAAGYFENPESTAKTFYQRTASGDYPYLRTGDLGFTDSSGELFVTGRIKDVIIINGRNIYPQDIETVAAQCNEAIHSIGLAAFQVDQGAVILAVEIERTAIHSANYRELGQQIAKQVGVKCEVMLDEIIFTKPFKLPKTTSGKIQRSKTKQLYNTGELEPIANWRRKTIDSVAKDKKTSNEAFNPKGLLDALKNVVQRKSGILASEIWDTSKILDLGVDSISLVEIHQEFNARAANPISLDSLFNNPTLEEIVNLSTQPATSSVNQRFDLGPSDFDKIVSQIPQVDRIVSHQSGRDLVIDGANIIDFASCNYLGLDYHPAVIASVPKMVSEWGVHPSWTRAVASPEPYLALEKELAELLGAPDTLVFPNVAMLNFGILPLLVGSTGTLICDYEAHHTIQEACDLAQSRGAQYLKFRYGDLADLEYKLSMSVLSAPIVITVDGVYSMSVGYVNLPEIIKLAEKYNAIVFIDDAHGFGIIGENPSGEAPYGHRGNGIANYFGLELASNKILYVAGLSKAYSSHAAFITCWDSDMKKRFQRASTYVFSGPVPVATLASALSGLEVNRQEGSEIRTCIFSLSKKLVDGARILGFEVDNTGYFPVAFVVIGKMEDTVKACQIAWEYNLLLTPGIFPAVPLNRSGLRLSITALNTPAHIDQALAALHKIRSTLFI